MSHTEDSPISPTEPPAPEGLPTLPTNLTDDQIRDILSKTARRGRLPGYEPPKAAGVLFTISDFGFPFESRLTARRASDAIAFETRLKPALPAVFIAILVVTVWPGVWFTESMLETWLPDTLVTKYVWWWYLISTVPFLPWAMWAAVKKSRQSARAEARDIIGKIKKALENSKPANQQTSK